MASTEVERLTKELAQAIGVADKKRAEAIQALDAANIAAAKAAVLAHRLEKAQERISA